MIKTIEFGDKQVQFSTSFAWTFIYRSQFGKDAAKVLMPVIKEIYTARGEEQTEDAAMGMGQALFEMLGFTGIAEIAWSMARLCDKTIPEPIIWVSSFDDDFPIADLVEELIPEAINSCFASKKSKVPTPEETKKTAPKKN